MKKLTLLAICVMAVMVSCKNKGQSAPADSSDSLTAVIDSIIEENDTTPLPMFLIGGDEKYMHMLYWANIEEPQRSEGDEAYFDTWHKSWELQEMFRRNAAQYTNRIVLDMVKKVRFVDEVLKDPDGNTPSIGEIHGRGEIPALCARFEYVNPKDNNPDEPGWGTVICTDSYLKSRKQLSIEVDDEIDTYLELPADGEPFVAVMDVPFPFRIGVEVIFLPIAHPRSIAPVDETVETIVDVDGQIGREIIGIVRIDDEHHRIFQVQIPAFLENLDIGNRSPFRGNEVNDG